MRTTNRHTGCTGDEQCPHCRKYADDPAKYAAMMATFGYAPEVRRRGKVRAEKGVKG